MPDTHQNTGFRPVSGIDGLNGTYIFTTPDPRPRCHRLALTVQEASDAVCDAKERGQDVIRAERCDRCGAMHMHRKEGR